MTEKLDYKKAYKNLYAPKPHPSLVEVPKIRFVVIEEEFALATEALYG